MSRTVRPTVAAAIAVVAAAGLTACAGRAEEAPKETTAPTPSSSAVSPPSLSPTEKQNVGSFRPSVTAHPAPTALPGRHRW